MAENKFTTRFGNIIKQQVCTTTADLNFDNYTTPGTYEIFEDMGGGKNRVYFLTVDKSADGSCVSQTRTHCGKMEYRCSKSSGAWSDWTEATGGGGNIEEQLQDIREDVATRESASNKKADAEYIRDFHNHKDYPTTRAVHDYVEGEKTQILQKVDWKLIETVTLTEDVQWVYCDLKEGFYKELYIRFVVPTMNPDSTSGFQKARSWVYANGNGTAYSVWDDGDYRYEDTGKDWILSHHLTMIGNICTCERKKYDVASGPYNIGTPGFTIGKDIGEPNIYSLSVRMYPNGTRLFPAGTTYELWGVRA